MDVKDARDYRPWRPGWGNVDFYRPALTWKQVKEIGQAAVPEVARARGHGWVERLCHGRETGGSRVSRDSAGRVRPDLVRVDVPEPGADLGLCV